MGSVARPRSNTLLIFVLLALLIVVVFYVFSTSRNNVNVGTSTSDQDQGQCSNGGQKFDDLSEAFTLAQTAEQYRSTKPFSGNYGMASYTICYKDGTQQRQPSDVFPGYNNTVDSSKPRNATHSEQASFGWLQNRLSKLPLDRQKGVIIHTVIFSQVPVCDLCQGDMTTWQKKLREVAGIPGVFLHIWDISPARKFLPATFPAGDGTPITLGDLRKVLIPFVP